MIDWMFDHPTVPILLLAAAFACLLYVAVEADADGKKEWAAFVEQHECVITERRDAETSTGIAPIVGGTGGVAVTTSTTPAQDAWLCNDGITYWKKASWTPEEYKP